MPIVNIDLGWLNRLLGKEFPAEVISESLEQIGCDVEEIAEVMRSRCPNCRMLVEHPAGQQDVRTCGLCGFEGEAPFQHVGALGVVRLDLLAARPDLFDVGGLARALRGTLGLARGLPRYEVSPSGLKVIVDASLSRPQSHHPSIAAAVMTLPQLDESTLVAVMKLQENLHWGVGRDRKLASIGVYDLSTIQGDIHYTTLDPERDSFVPLGADRPMTGKEILTKHPKGTAYAHLLEGFDRYPVLRDSLGQVLSMPPVINSDETRLNPGVRRVFIEVTGPQSPPVVKTLNTLICSLAEIGGSIESVEIEEADGSRRTSPNLDPGEAIVELEEAKRWLGLPLDEAALLDALHKMRFDTDPVESHAGRVRVRYPAYRTDIRHMVDLLEDVAIGYGYQNIEPKLVPSLTVGMPRREEALSDQVRQTLIGLGFTEVMSLPLTTEEEHYRKLRLEIPGRYARVSNPKLKAYTVMRSHLMGGLMETLRENRRRPMPLRFFEIDNTILLEEGTETGVREERRVGLVEIGEEAGYASARSVVDSLLRELGAKARFEVSSHPTFVAGRVGDFTTDSEIAGVLGEVHPEVLTNFGLTYPVAMAELVLTRVF